MKFKIATHCRGRCIALPSAMHRSAPSLACELRYETRAILARSLCRSPPALNDRPAGPERALLYPRRVADKACGGCCRRARTRCRTSSQPRSWDTGFQLNRAVVQAVPAGWWYAACLPGNQSPASTRVVRRQGTLLPICTNGGAPSKVHATSPIGC